MLKLIKNQISFKWYIFVHWFFMWNQDDDGDVTLSIANLIHFTKYKEHTIVRYGWKQYKPAEKYQGYKEREA